MLKFLPLLLVLSFAAVPTVRAQVPGPPAGPSPATRYALALYDSATTESQHLYNGPQYYFYDSQAQDHPFFQGREWSTGTVYYDGQLFPQVPMLYDVVKDQLVIRYTEGLGNVSLQSEKVGYFTLAGEHHFARMEAQPGLRPGFYEVLYNGPTKVLARRVKERQEQIVVNRLTVEFPVFDHYYLFHSGRYHPAPTRRAALALMPEQKKKLRQYLRDQSLDFRQNRQGTLTALAAYYDQLSRP
jgi:hypothetical protein